MPIFSEHTVKLLIANETYAKLLKLNDTCFTYT